MKWLPLKPLQAFAATSLVLVAAMVVAVSLIQSRFFRDAVIERESVIVHDLVVALAQEYLSPREFEHFETPEAKQKFGHAFISLTDVSGVVRVKVYNDQNIVVWSDDAAIIGHYLPKTPEHIAQMWAGRPSGIFDPTKRPPSLRTNCRNDCSSSSMCPSRCKAPRVPWTKQRGWWRYTASGLAGHHAAERDAAPFVHSGHRRHIAFFALFHLFRAVHRRQREAELQFARLSSEHERIVQMEKLSAIGHMLTEIAHQFNNPWSVSSI